MGNDFLPCITIPTRITDHSATIIDHINVFRPLREISNKIISGNLFIDVSDHLPNFIILEGYTHDFSINNRPLVRNYSEIFKALFKTKISEINWTEIVKSDNPDIAYSAFINKFQEEFNRCFPRKKLSRKRCKDKCWITKGLLVSIRYKNILYRKHMNKPNSIHKLAAYKRYPNVLTNLLGKAEKDYYSHLITQDKSSSKNIWKLYRTLMGKTTAKRSPNLNKLITEKGVVYENKNIADAFNNYFSNIGLNLANSYPVNDNYMKYLSSNYSNTMFLYPITEEELTNEIHQLPQNKAPEIDDIPSKLVQLTASYIIQTLTKIYNLSFLNGCVPEKLKIAKIIPIYKKKEKTHPCNYRPISLLSVFNKLLEKVMAKRITNFLDKFNILSNHQFGFRTNHSTILV